MHVRVKSTPGAKLPTYATSGSAGADIYANVNNKKGLLLEPGEVTLVSTGLFLEIPHGYEAQIRPRSGLAAKHGITILNTPGTIDSDYRGEIKIILINLGNEDFYIHSGDRIAQMVLSPVVQCAFDDVDAINDSDRGCGGFGSTGK